VHEIADRDERLKEIAREYAKQPEGMLVVSPDNQSRMEINQTIHRRPLITFAKANLQRFPYIGE
jgi:hypothetical protein